MGVVPSKAKEQILNEQRVRWRRAVSRETPSWFAGREFDLLAPTERDKLYRKVLAGNRWARLVVLICVWPTVIGTLLTGHNQVVGIALAISWALGEVGSRLFRRRILLAAARRHVQASV